MKPKKGYAVLVAGKFETIGFDDAFSIFPTRRDAERFVSEYDDSGCKLEIVPVKIIESHPAKGEG